MTNEMTKEQSDTMLKLGLKMAALGIKAQFSRLEPGPIITGYYFKPNAAQPLSKIEKHEEDFALAAEQETVTIRRDKGEVIIFVPNKERKIIDFKDTLYWMISKRSKPYTSSSNESDYDTCVSFANIPILLGVNHLGNNTGFDLTEQPHVLMAGSTGSGKSTFQSAIVCSLAVIMEPDELNLYLIDTKKLDLPLFKDLPHVLQVADDIHNARQIFQDLLDLTRKRYDLLQSERVRNVAEYNRISRTNNYSKLPYRVLIIDELADLLALDKDYCDIVEDSKSIKKYLQELSQIARAAGTHIIAATQRPSVKIIDGDTKNNFPTRIGLKMPTWQDSVTVLGEPGAETLLGKGDMFVKRVDSSILERYHGPFVKLDDIEQIVQNLNAVKQSLSFVR